MISVTDIIDIKNIFNFLDFVFYGNFTKFSQKNLPKVWEYLEKKWKIFNYLFRENFDKLWQIFWGNFYKFWKNYVEKKGRILRNFDGTFE